MLCRTSTAGAIVRAEVLSHLNGERRSPSDVSAHALRTKGYGKGRGEKWTEDGDKGECYVSEKCTLYGYSGQHPVNEEKAMLKLY